MSKDTIYDRVAKLEDQVEELQKDAEIFRHLLKNKIAKLEIKRVKEGKF